MAWSLPIMHNKATQTKRTEYLLTSFGLYERVVEEPQEPTQPTEEKKKKRRQRRKRPSTIENPTAEPLKPLPSIDRKAEDTPNIPEILRHLANTPNYYDLDREEKEDLNRYFKEQLRKARTGERVLTQAEIHSFNIMRRFMDEECCDIFMGYFTGKEYQEDIMNELKVMRVSSQLENIHLTKPLSAPAPEENTKKGKKNKSKNARAEELDDSQEKFEDIRRELNFYDMLLRHLIKTQHRVESAQAEEGAAAAAPAAPAAAKPKKAPKKKGQK